MITIGKVYELKDADDSFGLFDTLDSAMSGAREVLNAEDVKVEWDSTFKRYQIIADGELEHLWIEGREILSDM